MSLLVLLKIDLLEDSFRAWLKYNFKISAPSNKYRVRYMKYKTKNWFLDFALDLIESFRTAASLESCFDPNYSIPKSNNPKKYGFTVH